MGYLWIIIALIVIYLLYCFGIFLFACLRLKPHPGTENPNSTWYKHRDEIQAGANWYRAQPSEKLTITSRDGKKLAGYYLPCEGSKNTIILAHGYRSSRFIDFSCVYELYHELGLNILSLDMRSHGDSEGRFILFGVAERYDIVDWAKFVNEKYHPDKIILDGVSMGAASVLMAVDLDLPSNVAGVIADSAFTSPKAIWEYVAKKDMRFSQKWAMPGVCLMVRLFTGYDPNKASAVQSVKKAKIPILFIHGEADDFVPYEMGLENYEACQSPKTFVSVPGAEHACGVLIDREKCVEALKKFLKSIGVM